jgi:hypothetical protein
MRPWWQRRRTSQIGGFRRTFASGLQKLGAKPEVIDRCLNHANIVKGVAAVYMRSQYLPERRAALELRGQHVAEAVK